MSDHSEPAARRFVGADVLLPHGIEQTEVIIAGSRIVSVGQDWQAASADLTAQGPVKDIKDIDVSGMLLAPGMIDIHGDAFERQIMPRANVFFPVPSALLETDRQLAGNGISTAYHAMTISWEPGLRSLEMAQQLVEQFRALQGQLLVDHRLQLRWETFAFEAIEFIEQMLESSPTPALAFNDHTSMLQLDDSVPVYERPFDQVQNYPVIDREHPTFIKRIRKRADRCMMEPDQFGLMVDEIWKRREQVPEKIQTLAKRARELGVPMLSHDDSQLETRAYYRDMGVRVAEFPMQNEVVQDTRVNGEYTVFGAPNVVRGGSHIGSLSAADMVEQDLCDILASDYFYPSLLMAVDKLHREKVRPLHELWKLISTNAAAALGLEDRGQLAPEQRADITVLDWQEGGEPKPRLTLSAGRVSYSSLPYL